MVVVMNDKTSEIRPFVDGDRRSVTAVQFLQSARRQPWLLMYADLCRTAADIVLCKTADNFERNQSHFVELYWASRARVSSTQIVDALDRFYSVLSATPVPTDAVRVAAFQLIEACQKAAEAEPALEKYLSWFDSIIGRIEARSTPRA